MYWPQMPPMQPMFYPMGMPMGGGTPSKDDYVKFLKKELKAAKTKDDGKKKDEKKIWWKRFEVGAALFFFSPVIATAWVAMLELSWHVVRSLAVQ